MEQNIGFKELYSVTLKATYPIEMNGRTIEVGETIAAFDRIQIANFEERKSFISANGGFDNRAHVWWEETKEIQILLSQGVFSKEQLSVMAGAKLLKDSGASVVRINNREVVETDENGVATTKHQIAAAPFVYEAVTGAKITEFSFEGNTINTGKNYQTLMVDYCYDYDNGYSVLEIGSSLTNGYLSLEGRTRVKDDITGQITTGIIKIPKLKLLSTLSMRLGRDAVPLVGRIDAVAVPTGERGHKKVMELIFLSDDIDSDM